MSKRGSFAHRMAPAAAAAAGLVLLLAVYGAPAGAGGRAVLGRSAPHVRVAAARYQRPIVSLGANRSSNWSGYNQGSIQQGGETFTQISGTWTVPKATQHKAGEAEYSSSWVGIGGGCVDAGCTLTDGTLIQAGIEQDVAKSGVASYSAWWEIIPEPSTTITTITVHAGDKVQVTISDPTDTDQWTVVVKDLTNGQTFTKKTPYPSTHATAEWIVETPVVIDRNGNVTVGPLPNLSRTNFNLGRVNGAAPNLQASEEIQLVDPNTNQALATPSSPDPTKDGFNDCAYATTCPAPQQG